MAVPLGASFCGYGGSPPYILYSGWLDMMAASCLLISKNINPDWNCWHESSAPWESSHCFSLHPSVQATPAPHIMWNACTKAAQEVFPPHLADPVNSMATSQPVKFFTGQFVPVVPVYDQTDSMSLSAGQPFDSMAHFTVSNESDVHEIIWKFWKCGNLEMRENIYSLKYQT